MRAGLELQPRIRAAADDARDHFLVPAVLARIVGFDFHLPTLALGVARIHAEQVAGEDRGLVAAGAGAHFQEQVAFVARIARHQQQRELAVERLQPRLRSGGFLLGHLAQLGVGAHRFGSGQVRLGACFLGQRQRHRLQLGELARIGAEALVVADDVGMGEQAFQFFAAFGQRFELTAQGRRHSGSRWEALARDANSRAFPGTGDRRRATVRRRR